MVYRHLARFFKYCLKFVTQCSEFSTPDTLVMHNAEKAPELVNRSENEYASH